MGNQGEWRRAWELRVDAARSEPATVFNHLPTAHCAAIRGPLELVTRAGVLSGLKECLLCASPHQYVWSFYADHLVPGLDDALDWQSNRVLPLVFEELAVRLRRGELVNERWARWLASADGPSFVHALQPASFATAFHFALKTREGAWCQSFANGLPIDAACSLPIDTDVAFLVAAQLDPGFFARLPYQERSVRMTLSEFTAGMTHVVWSPKDDLVESESPTSYHLLSLIEAQSQRLREEKTARARRSLHEVVSTTARQSPAARPPAEMSIGSLSMSRGHMRPASASPHAAM
ncbi:MAG: hypothetical protein ACLQVD_12635 [Capsulimonadaceae bacterium]